LPAHGELDAIMSSNKLFIRSSIFSSVVLGSLHEADLNRLIGLPSIELWLSNVITKGRPTSTAPPIELWLANVITKVGDTAVPRLTSLPHQGWKNSWKKTAISGTVVLPYRGY